MWKALLLLAFVASFDLVISGDDDEPPTPPTKTPDEPSCGCGEHPPKCDKNEEWNDCSDPICRPTRCSEVGYPVKCDKKCKPGCVCKADYVRDDNGVCIPIKCCPSCGGDPNAESGCGTNCGKTCATYKIKKPVCPLICLPNGCDCRDGYVYDPPVKKCVKPKDCTPTCKVNEEYSPCINGGCGPKNCSQLGQPDVCIDPECCIKGCVCVKGYLRAANGTCVPINKCPPPDCPCDEVWDTCPTVPCDGDWCPKTRDSPQTCPIGTVCDKPRCVCGPNRKRDWKTGKCILITDCPPFKCDCDEEYQACSPSCPSDKCSKDKPNCPKTDITANCRPQCRCRKGYCRNSEGKCVPEIPDCPSGEIWDTCPTVPCDGDWCPKTRDSPQTCPVGKKCEKPRCVCEHNKKRDWKTGKCIPITDCPPFKCDCNEEYQACPSNCPGDECSKNKPFCPKTDIIKHPCRPQCRCCKGFCRNSDGKCVIACDCSDKS